MSVANGPISTQTAREKSAERSRAYYARNREKSLARNRAYREANKERLAARRKEQYEANLEENRRKARERMRARHGSKPMDEYKRIRRATAASKKASKIAARPPKPVARPKGKCPPELRQAYSKASSDSIIRRKWPTLKDMLRHFEEAE